MSTPFSTRLLSALTAARCVVAFTGAGMSAESGVPTFRGTDGIWSKFKPEELASMSAFMKNPALVWEWYAERKRVISGIHPNAGHLALVRMQGLFPDFAVITQNIDNLHQRAGSTMVYELHGNIERNYCIKCGAPASNDEVLAQHGVPTCARCGGTIRPDVVWFGEMLPEDDWRHSERAMSRADVCLSIGTSGIVYPAASLPLLAKQQGAFLVEVNPERTPLSDVADEVITGPSGVILPALFDQVAASRSHSLQY